MSERVQHTPWVLDQNGVRIEEHETALFNPHLFVELEDGQEISVMRYFLPPEVDRGRLSPEPVRPFEALPNSPDLYTMPPPPLLDGRDLGDWVDVDIQTEQFGRPIQTFTMRCWEGNSLWDIERPLDRWYEARRLSLDTRLDVDEEGWARGGTVVTAPGTALGRGWSLLEQSIAGWD